MNDDRDILDQLREYHPDVSSVYVIDAAIAEIERLRAFKEAACKVSHDLEDAIDKADGLVPSHN